MMLWLISFDKGASFSDRARDLDLLASNLDWSPDGESTVPPASDGSYCSSSMQARGKRAGRRRGLVDAATAVLVF
jgi:hypothetical protein